MADIDGEEIGQNRQNDIKFVRTEQEPSNTTCSQIFKREICSNLFSLEESEAYQIDVAASFAPVAPRYVPILRVLFFIWSTVTLGISISQYKPEDRFIYMGYLTHWGLIISISYQLMAVILSFFRGNLAQPLCGEGPSSLVKLMWALYVIAAPMESVIVPLYWYLYYEPGSKVLYTSVYVHGILALIILVDGNILGRIPVRINQVVFFMSITILYAIWTLIHGYSGIGNGTTEGDQLYSVVDWKGDPAATAIYIVVIVFVVSPIFFLLTWFLSIWGIGCKFDGGRRRILNVSENMA